MRHLSYQQRRIPKSAILQGPVTLDVLSKDPKRPYGLAESKKDLDSLRQSASLSGSLAGLDDPLLLQILTHKSFAGGLPSHNEKLSFVGRKFFPLAVHLQGQEKLGAAADASSKFSAAVEVEQQMERVEDLSEFASKAGLQKLIYWNTKGVDGAEPSRKISSESVYAIVGAILLKKGEKAAHDFAKLVVNSQTRA